MDSSGVEESREVKKAVIDRQGDSVMACNSTGSSLERPAATGHRGKKAGVMEFPRTCVI